MEDNNGYPTKSIGTCSSNNGLAYLIPLIVIDALMLFYALYLCFVTRKVSSEYQEGTWITASILSILQILVLSIPILVIVDNDNSAFYFVRVAVIFLVSSTVTMLIFFPKMYKLHFMKFHQGRSRRTGFRANPGQNSSAEPSDSRYRSSMNSDKEQRYSIGSDIDITATAVRKVAFEMDAKIADSKQNVEDEIESATEKKTESDNCESSL